MSSHKSSSPTPAPADSTLSSSSSSSLSSTARETSNYLIRLSQDSIDLINARDWPSFRQLGEKHASPEFRSVLDNYHTAASFTEHAETLQHMATAAPDLHFTVVSASADVNELQGYASVYQMLEITGRPLRIKRVSVCMLKFRKVRGKWWV